MVMLQAFADDSASDVGEQRLYIAAFINGADQWADFSDRWARRLRRHPAIDYFKMSEAESLRGQFEGWSEADRDEKVLKLARVINESRPWSVHCSVSREQYERILAPVAPYNLQNPYFVCFWGVMHAAADYHRALGIGGVPPVDFVFDEQGGLGHDAALWYQWSKEQQEPEIRNLMGATPIFRDDKLVVPLQAADMLAWHLRRHHEKGGLETRPAMDLLTGQHRYHEVDAQTLQRLAAGFRRVPGVSTVQTKSSWNETRKTLRAHVAAGLPPPNMSYLRLLYLDRKTRLKAWWSRFRYPR